MTHIIYLAATFASFSRACLKLIAVVVAPLELLVGEFDTRILQRHSAAFADATYRPRLACEQGEAATTIDKNTNSNSNIQKMVIYIIPVISSLRIVRSYLSPLDLE